jgi:hypothetical protein
MSERRRKDNWRRNENKKERRINGRKERKNNGKRQILMEISEKRIM